MADKPKATKAKPTKSKNNTSVDEVPPVVETQESPKKSAWSIDSVFWGLLLVTIGGLLLLDNLGVISANWSNVWRLWPLVVIAAGLSLLTARQAAWKFVSMIFVLLSLIAVVVIATGGYTIDESRDDRQRESVRLESRAERAEVTIQAGASQLNIDSHRSNAIVEAELTGENMQLDRKSRLDGTTQKVVLSSTNQGSWFMPRRITWDVSLTDRLPLDVKVDAGASRVVADFSGTRLQNLEMDTGASSMTLTLGDKESQQKVLLDSGASSMTVRVPRDSGVKLTYDGGLSSKNIADLEEVSEGVYQSLDYDDAKNKIEITADVGLSSFTLERY